jgi:hypothetical protein
METALTEAERSRLNEYMRSPAPSRRTLATAYLRALVE